MNVILIDVQFVFIFYWGSQLTIPKEKYTLILHRKIARYVNTRMLAQYTAQICFKG